MQELRLLASSLVVEGLASLARSEIFPLLSCGEGGGKYAACLAKRSFRCVSAEALRRGVCGGSKTRPREVHSGRRRLDTQAVVSIRSGRRLQRGVK